MGVAIYPRIENTTAEWVFDIGGKALARNLYRLQRLLKKQGHKDLMDYYIPSEEDFEEWGRTPKEPEQEWFNPMEGLLLIDSMIQALKDCRGQFEFPEHLEEDLESFRKILYRAAGEGLRWNLGMTY